MSTISGVSSSSTSDPWADMKAQRSQMQARMFAKVDTDGNGSVDQTELKTMLSDFSQKTGASIGGSTADTFTKMDSNADGKLSSDELDKGMQSLMPPPSTMDFAQSRGGETSGTGGPGGPPPPPPAGGPGGASASSTQSYDPLDTNKDGTVSELERLVGDLKDLAATASGDGSTTEVSSQSIAKLAKQLYEQLSSVWSSQSGAESVSATA